MENLNNIQTPDKPLSVYIQDAKQSIISAVNSTGLHITLVEMIMKELYNEIKQQADATYSHETQRYENELLQYERALAELQEVSKEDEV